MVNKVIRLVVNENRVEINMDSQTEFLLQYQKAVLLALSEKGIIDDIQCQKCIDKLSEQFKKYRCRKNI